MTANEQALLAQMQDLGYSHGLCITALQILSQDKLAVSDMLAFIYDEHNPQKRTLSRKWQECVKPIVGHHRLRYEYNNPVEALRNLPLQTYSRTII